MHIKLNWQTKLAWCIQNASHSAAAADDDDDYDIYDDEYYTRMSIPNIK